MKYLVILLAVIALPLLGADCDKPTKDDQNGGCKTEVSQNLVNCLIRSTTNEQVIACHKADQQRRCDLIAKRLHNETLSKRCSVFTLKQVECLEKVKNNDQVVGCNLPKEVQKIKTDQK